MSYPKDVWVLTRGRVVLEDGKEVVDHTQDVVVGGTFSAHVAEKLAALLKQNESLETMVMSDVRALPLAVLEAIEPVKERTLLDEILEEQEKKCIP